MRRIWIDRGVSIDIRLPSPSFAFASDVLLAAATDVFDLYRSLLPSHFVNQVRNVPTLSMQVYNDAAYLSSRVEELKVQYPTWTAANDISARLNSLAEHIFETQLSIQRSSLFDILNDAEHFRSLGTQPGQQKTERTINALVGNIETLSSAFKVVLPQTIYHTVMGYLLDQVLVQIIDDILDMTDITETESERINDVLKPIRKLDQIFVLEEDQPSTVVADVAHWLKFCYVSELLQANLVDILYLFDSGALVDFTTQELVSLLRALFADSEKRDHAIERIEAVGAGSR